MVDSEERIWVRVPGYARRPPLGPKSGLLSSFGWVEDTVFDVYQANGTYMGVVVLPPGAWFVDASREVIWVIERGSLDEQYVVQYRMMLVHN